MNIHFFLFCMIRSRALRYWYGDLYIILIQSKAIAILELNMRRRIRTNSLAYGNRESDCLGLAGGDFCRFVVSLEEDSRCVKGFLFISL